MITHFPRLQSLDDKEETEGKLLHLAVIKKQYKEYPRGVVQKQT